MVALPDFRPWQFQMGLERIRSSFRASIQTMVEAERQAHLEHAAYLDSGRDDRAYDEDGTLLGSTETELQFAGIEAAFAAEVVREAFVTSAFHYWERSARAWTRCDPRTAFKDLASLVRAAGYTISPDLTFLNTLNNLLKHDNPARGEEVFAQRPDLFLWGRRPSGDEWCAHLRLGNADVEAMMDAVAASGPRPATSRP